MSRAADGLDRRLTPARPDLAALHLEGRVEAERFIEGRPFTVEVEVADLRRAPRPDAGLETQLLFGDPVVCYDEHEGWSWVQSERDGYVGYVASCALRPGRLEATHRVAVHRTFVYAAANMKTPPLAALPLDGRVRIGAVHDGFAAVAPHGFVYARHLAPLGESVADPVATAESFVGTPYLWGGVSALGIDCSGLVQRAFSMGGIALPRDTDMQMTCGTRVAVTPQLHDLVRGDLVFWSGHVGIMTSPTMLVHANAHHMLVAIEPLAEAQARILSTTGLPIAAIRRLARPLMS